MFEKGDEKRPCCCEGSDFGIPWEKWISEIGERHFDKVVIPDLAARTDG